MIGLSNTNEFALLTPFLKNPVFLCCFLQRKGFSGSTGSGNRSFSDLNTSILKNAFEDPRRRERSVHSAPSVFWSVDRSPALHQVLRSCLRGHTLLRYAFSAIWTIGFFLPPWSENVHLDERVFPVSLCHGGSSQPLRTISRDRAVSPSSGGATASSHLRNSFGLPRSGKPQCEICPFHCSFLPNPQTFPQDARWHLWSVSVLAMGSPLLGSRLFFLSTRS